MKAARFIAGICTALEAEKVCIAGLSVSLGAYEMRVITEERLLEMQKQYDGNANFAIFEWLIRNECQEIDQLAVSNLRPMSDETTQLNEDLNNCVDVINYLVDRFDNEIWSCRECGEIETTREMDSAIYLREWIQENQSILDRNEQSKPEQP